MCLIFLSWDPKRRVISKYGCVISGKVKFDSQNPRKIRLISVAA